MKGNYPLVWEIFKGDTRKIEMSRYIDLDLYHRVERTHPFYEEMIREICRLIREFSRNSPSLNIMEIGAGTGLSTSEILKNDRVWLDAIELDEECCELHKRHIENERCKCFCDDAVTFCREGNYDIVVSVFAHDHITQERGRQLAENIKRNLKPGGVYIMGGEILPYYRTEYQMKKALYAYHCYIVQKALRDRNFEVAQIEINALKSGLDKIGDFKRHESMFEEEVASSGLKLRKKKKMGPIDVKDVGGVFVYVHENRAR